MTQDPNPHEALASIRAVRADLPGAATYPLSYDLAYGGACALLVSAQGLPRPWDFIALGVSVASFVVMIRWWRKTLGWWVSGYSPRRARWVAIGLAVGLIGLMLLSAYGRHVGPHWLWMVSAGLGFVGSIAGSRLWMRTWRKELAEGPR